MPTPSDKVYRVKQSREEMLRKKRDGMKRWRAENPEASKARTKKNHIKHRDEIIARVTGWVKANPERTATTQRKCHLMQKYGITPDEWSAIFASQGRRCAICRTPNPHGKRKSWDTDHCHSTGKVRGILCHPCNMMIGGAKDNPETLRLAVNYLMLNP